MNTIGVTKAFGLAVLLGALHLATPAHASTILLAENFDDITTLAGWTQINNSDPGGATDWFQGNALVFPSQAGAPDSYIAANFINAGIGGAISNWLILPELAYATGDSLTFWTRSAGGFPDRLEVRFAAGGGANVGSNAGSVGDFTTLFLTINPALNVGGYPDAWTEFAISLTALDGLTGRLAFRYTIDDTNLNGEYIGIDTVAVSSAAVPVPEPATLTLVGLGVAGAAARRRRQLTASQKG